MNIIVVAVLATMVFGAPLGIILSLAAAVIAAGIRSRGTLHERALGMLGMGFLRASVAFSLAWLVLDDWLGVADWLEVAIIWLIAAFIIDAWRAQGAAPNRDRWGLVARFVAALAGFAMAWLLINWVTMPTAVWLVAVALLASGVFGATLRWPALPWFAGTMSWARMLGLVANLAICALIIAVAFV
jgi:hypothetical protein